MSLATMSAPILRPSLNSPLIALRVTAHLFFGYDDGEATLLDCEGLFLSVRHKASLLGAIHHVYYVKVSLHRWRSAPESQYARHPEFILVSHRYYDLHAIDSAKAPIDIACIAISPHNLKLIPRAHK